jgi:hypothetical protein
MNEHFLSTSPPQMAGLSNGVNKNRKPGWIAETIPQKEMK